MAGCRQTFVKNVSKMSDRLTYFTYTAVAMEIPNRYTRTGMGCWGQLSLLFEMILQ